MGLADELSSAFSESTNNAFGHQQLQQSDQLEISEGEQNDETNQQQDEITTTPVHAINPHQLIPSFTVTDDLTSDSEQ